MTRKLVKYKLVNGKAPEFIEDGGYFPEGEYLYGISKEGVSTETAVNVTDKDLDGLITKYNAAVIAEYATPPTITMEQWKARKPEFTTSDAGG